MASAWGQAGASLQWAEERRGGEEVVIDGLVRPFMKFAQAEAEERRSSWSPPVGLELTSPRPDRLPEVELSLGGVQRNGLEPHPPARGGVHPVVSETVTSDCGWARAPAFTASRAVPAQV